MKRKAVSVRVRFEVLKRDRFTCQYCGKHPPDVLLEVDHVLPVAAGGNNEAENLTTACSECNGGKSDRLLAEGSAPSVSAAAIAHQRDRLEQAKHYLELMQKQRDLVSDQLWLVTVAWAEAFGAARTEESGTVAYRFSGANAFPAEASVRLMLQRLPLGEILEAVTIAADKFPTAARHTERYFFGICWRKIRKLEGAT